MAKHLKTQNPFVTLPMIFLFLMLLLINVKSDSFSFSFSNFTTEQFDLGFLGDARPVSCLIELTYRNKPYGVVTMRQHSVGRVVYVPPVQLWDKNRGKVADFETEFSFVVDTGYSLSHGDGLSFFIIPYDSDPNIPKNSSGGYLGLFSPETAFNSYKNQIVAIEFDSFENEWDPKPVTIAPHIGIDINSLESVKTAEWPIDNVFNSVGKARISYDSKAKELSVLVGYTNIEPNKFVSLTQSIDLPSVLPEWVRIGFSGATGDQTEAHDIHSWSFTSRI